MVSIALSLALAESKLTSDPTAIGPALQVARQDLMQAMEELRELSHGIRPAALVERGLGAALDDLARRSAIPARLDLHLTEPLPEEVETAAYFVASEALANIAKHSQADEVLIKAETNGSCVTLTVADNGIGGVVADRGSGLRGLADRVEGMGGAFTVTSVAGKGTQLEAVLPCA